MPLHSHPKLRAREEAEETEGLIKTLTSAGVQRLLDQEGLNTRKKVVPVQHRLVLRGTVYVAT